MTKWTAKPKSWQLQEAKAKFSEVFERAFTEGPQFVTRRGKEEAVLLSSAEYRKLLARKQPKATLLQILQSAPSSLADLDLRRDNDPDRRTPDFAEE